MHSSVGLKNCSLVFVRMFRFVRIELICQVCSMILDCFVLQSFWIENLKCRFRVSKRHVFSCHLCIFRKNIVFVPGYRKEVRFFAYVRVGNDLCVYLEKLLENWRFSNFNKSTKHRNMERAFRKLSLNKLENFYRYQSSSKHNIPDSRIESFQFALVSMMNHNSWFVHLKLILKTKIRMLYFNKTIWEVSKRYNMTRARDEFVTFPQRTSKVCFCISQFHTQLKFQNKDTIEAQFMFTLMQLN